MLPEGGAFRAKMPFARTEARDGPSTEQERKGVHDESPLIPELEGAHAAEQGPNGQREPGCRLRERVGCMEFLRGRDTREDRRPAAREEWRREHQRPAESVEQPALLMRGDENKSECDHAACEVAGDHHLRRSKRSSATPEIGPARIAGTVAQS